jgi:hypothetical protein
MIFINTSCSHPMWRWHCYDWISVIQKPPHAFHPQYIIYFTKMSNTLHEDMKTIVHSLIRGFLQTHSVDVINRASFSHKASGIGELHTSLKLNFSLSIDAEDGGRQVCELCIL